MRCCVIRDEQGRNSYCGGSYNGFGTPEELGEAVRMDSEGEIIELIDGLDNNWLNKIRNERGRCSTLPFSKIERAEFLMGYYSEDSYNI